MLISRFYQSGGWIEIQNLLHISGQQNQIRLFRQGISSLDVILFKKIYFLQTFIYFHEVSNMDFKQLPTWLHIVGCGILNLNYALSEVHAETSYRYLIYILDMEYYNIINKEIE